MKIYIDTTADPKNALIAGQADNQAATMPTLFYGDNLPLQVAFTDGAGSPAEFTGEPNVEIIFAIGYLVPRQTITQTTTSYSSNIYFSTLDLATDSLKNAIAGQESIDLTFEIQFKNGAGHSKTLVQSTCTVRNQLNLFSYGNSTAPTAPGNVNLGFAPPPAAPSGIDLSKGPIAPSGINLEKTPAAPNGILISTETAPAAPNGILISSTPPAPDQILLNSTPAAPSTINLDTKPTAPGQPTMQFKSVLIGFEATGLTDSRLTGYYQKINNTTFKNLNNNNYTALNTGTNRWDFYSSSGSYIRGFSQDNDVLNIYTGSITINQTYYSATELPTAPSEISLSAELAPTAPASVTGTTPILPLVYHGTNQIFNSSSTSYNITPGSFISFAKPQNSWPNEATHYMTRAYDSSYSIITEGPTALSTGQNSSYQVPSTFQNGSAQVVIYFLDSTGTSTSDALTIGHKVINQGGTLLSQQVSNFKAKLNII